jgi:hypothetical protein
MNRRSGIDGEEFGITFALAMPDQWNDDLLMQGEGGSNGIVLAPLGLNAAGDTLGLIRGFAVGRSPTVVSLSEARTVQGPGRHGRRS